MRLLIICQAWTVSMGGDGFRSAAVYGLRSAVAGLPVVNGWVNPRHPDPCCGDWSTAGRRSETGDESGFLDSILDHLAGEGVAVHAERVGRAMERAVVAREHLRDEPALEFPMGVGIADV